MVSSFQDAVVAGSGMLTDGGIETRIMLETDVPLPEHVQVAALVTDPTGGPCCVDIYESYVVAASPFGLPMIIGTPTFRACAPTSSAAPGSAATRRCGSPTQTP